MPKYDKLVVSNVPADEVILHKKICEGAEGQFHADPKPDGTFTVTCYLPQLEATAAQPPAAARAATPAAAAAINIADDGEPVVGGNLLPGRPAIRLSADGKIATGVDGLEIEYSGSDSCPYGKQASAAAEKFAGVVIHHTAKNDLDWYVAYQINGDEARGGHFGYHFYVSDKGRIVQGAPLTKRTNHIKSDPVVREELLAHLRNANAIGVACVGAGKPSGFAPTKAQVKAAEELVFALLDAFSIPRTSVCGHGEIQLDRMDSEGRSLAAHIRSL